MSADDDMELAIAGLLPLVVGSVMVGVRGEVHQQVTALVLAVTVVLGGRIGGRRGGIAAALVAAATFDFFHTRPYLSLKIADTDDILTTALLLVVGVAVGGLAVRASRDERHARRRRDDSEAVTRVLAVASKGSVEDVETSVRAELLDLLSLQSCRFTAEPVVMPTLAPWGEMIGAIKRYAPDGFELPPGGLAIPVEAHDHLYGHFVCVPVPGIGVEIIRRRAAVAAAEVLALVREADPAVA